MDHVTLSLAVGAVAGALVAIPMIFQRSSGTVVLLGLLRLPLRGSPRLQRPSALPAVVGAGNGRRHDADRSPALRLFGQGAQGDPRRGVNALLFGFLISAAERYL